MRIVLLGDSHLARVQRDLSRLGRGDPQGSNVEPVEIVNRAAGGAIASDLASQAAAVGVGRDDHVAVSVGTNDAAPGGVPVGEVREHLEAFLASVILKRLVYLVPPGVDEVRLNGPNDRTNAVMRTYASTAAEVLAGAGAVLIDGPSLVAPLGRKAFVADGIHLSGRAYDRVLSALRTALCDCQEGRLHDAKETG